MILCGCVDEIPVDDFIIGEGEAEVSAVVEFNPMVASLENNSRGAAGNAIKNIRELSVVIYDSNKKLYKIYNTEQLKNLALEIKQDGNSQMPPDVDSSKQSEATTAKATFKLPAIPFGKYYMYAVANVGDVTEEMAETPEKLKSFRVDWKTDVSKNDQMFGYFTTMSNQESGFFDAPPFIVNKKNVEAHSWIKRLASKVTLVYDGSGLHEGIFIYIHSVQIKDIPKTCMLGEDNTPSGDGSVASVESQLISDGDHIFYNEKGEILDDDLYPNIADYRDHWLEIDKSTVAGAVEKDEDGKLKYDQNGKLVCHGENATALYFYENMQGNYKDRANKEYYNKQPNSADIWKDQSQGHEGYKDNVPYGTYIEVDGYYLSINPNNQSYGKIKYRFMLGKDTEYDYNAQRNHHYKLTLKFRGYANQPEWHIEYEEDEPGLYPPEMFYMPYLYNRRQEFPVRFTGRPTKLVAQIIENNWAPYDSESPDSVPLAEVVSPGAPANMAFKWYRKVYETVDGGVEWLYGRHTKSFYDNLGLTYDPDINYKKGGVTPIWVGFLGLKVPDKYNSESTRLPTGYYNTPGTDFYDRKTSVEGLRDDYIDEKIYRQEYAIDYNSLKSDEPTQVGSGRNSYKVQLNKDNSVTAMIPMFTQPKALIYISGFSGGNPYEAYRRKAVVRLTAYYEGGQTISKNVPVYQVRRVVNPKGIWRRWNNTDPFNVTLTHQESAGSSKFVPVESFGEWMAYISKENSTSDEPGTSSFITLSGGSRVENGVVYGTTGSDVSFTVNFSGVNEFEYDCSRIVVKYHGFTCEHTILVRQGYFKAIPIASSCPNTLWSSFSVYKFNDGDFMESTKEVNAEMTVSPLALGTLYKRGNYKQGIRIINNNEFGPLVKLGDNELTLTDGAAKWGDIDGVPYNRQSSVAVIDGKQDANTTWKWTTFKAIVDGQSRHYRFPTYDEYNALVNEADFGYGVLYADGASEPADNVETAFKFYNVGNTLEMSNSEFGMRGVFVYNPNNFNNVFFPVGAFGIGRRTIQNTEADEKGYLRYGAVNRVLSAENNAKATNANGVIPGQYSNTYRPICYNLPASPGALYWIGQPTSGGIVGWDMNYFDMSFNGQDYGASYYPDGDAFPIKPIYVSTDSEK